MISATHRNLWGAVEAGEFREDLYYRIAVYPIATPPLRERRDDIPLLAQHALSTFSQELGSGVDEISVDALARMMDYDWPGNVRELHNVIQRAIVLTKGSVLGVESLPQPLIAATALSVAPSHQSDGAGIATLADAERQTIQRALALAEGNIVAAARMLNLHRSSLYRKMERHDIDTGRRDTSRPA